jgi:hypothetical protein
MSNKLTRKGLAFGGMVGLVASVFAGVPAAQANVANIILSPYEGETYNSILQSGVVLNAEINALDEDASIAAPYLTFRVTNSGEKDIQVDFDGGAGSSDRQTRETTDTAPTSSAGLTWDTVETGDDNIADNVFPTGHLESHQAAETTTDDKFVFVSGAKNVDDADTDTTGPDASGTYSYENLGVAGSDNLLYINTTETTGNVTLKVIAWLDEDRDGFIDTFEERTTEQTVVLYGPGNYSATTTMYETTRSAEDLKAKVVFNNSINAYFVEEDLDVDFYKDGTYIATDEDGQVNADDVLYFDDATYGDLDDATLGSGIYHARALYTGASEDYFVGARSVSLDLRNGSSTAVTDVDMSVADTVNVAFDEEAGNTVDVRTGTKSLTITAQAVDDGVNLLASNIQVRAVVSGIALGATSSVTVTGATGTITSEDDSIVASGFTNSNGQVSFVINNTVGAADDEISVAISVKNSAGVFVPMTNSSGTVEVLWQDAALSSFEPSAEVVSGATVNVEFKAADQWGVGLDSNATLGRYSVHVQAYIAGVVKPTTYSETKVTTNGVAAFSFTNFVTAGNNEEIVATLKNGNADVASSGAIVNPLYVDVYNNLATDSITLANAFEARVSYVDYVVGDLDTAAVAKEADDKGVLDAFADDTHAVINGTVLNANNQGQPGAVVTVAVPGALLWDEATNVLAKDTITTVANSLGYFEVEALVQKVNTAGATITVTSGGKSATSKLKSYLPYNLSAQNLKLSWTLPTVVVKNTTYSVKATLTDVWGNPLRSWEPSNYSHVDFSAAGALQVNGEDSVAKEFNAAGEVTVFLRSVADVGGPGTLTMTLDEDDYEYATGKSGEYDDVTDTTSEFEDNSFTSWDESKWSGSLSAEFDVKDVAPVTGKVNVGSFNGKLVVYASGLNGARISWKVGGNWGSAVATSNYSIFNRPTPRAGATVSVEVFVNGVKQLTKSVVTR